MRRASLLTAPRPVPPLLLRIILITCPTPWPLTCVRTVKYEALLTSQISRVPHPMLVAVRSARMAHDDVYRDAGVSGSWSRRWRQGPARTHSRRQSSRSLLSAPPRARLTRRGHEVVFHIVREGRMARVREVGEAGVSASERRAERAADCGPSRAAGAEYEQVAVAFEPADTRPPTSSSPSTRLTCPA